VRSFLSRPWRSAEPVWRPSRRAAPLAVTASSGMALLSLLLRHSANLIGYVAIGPLVAAITLGAGMTALIAGYSVAIALLLGVANGTFGTRDHLLRCGLVLTVGGFSTFIAFRRGQRELALLRMTRVAEVAQRAILRPLPAQIGGVALAARYLSAAHEALVGGDFYEVAATPYGVRLIVGDVKGKGLEAVRVAEMVLGGFRQAASSHTNLADLAIDLDRAVSHHLDEEDFVTVVLAEFASGAELRVLNCGHPPPLLLRDDKAILLDQAITTPLGLDPTPSAQQVVLQAGDRLLVYTDGLIEARAADGRRFDLEELDESAAILLSPHSLDDAVDRLLDVVLHHAGGELDDDLALVLAQPHVRRSTQRSARRSAAIRA
jgi:sigma-B regulation protein RsbU (phosphoserine phosphatase)